MSYYCPTCYRPIPDSTAALCEGGHRPGVSNWPALPATLYNFRLTEVVGRGGFGTVYAAEQEGQRRPQVVKVAAVPRGADLELVRRFYNREAAAHVELRDTLADYRRRGQTPPIVDGYRDLNDPDQWPAAVMNRVTEPTLERLLQGGPLPEAMVLQLGISACRPLHLLASFRMVHCDIKPANFFVSKSGEVQLADLGSWEREGETIGQGVTLTGTPLPQKLPPQLSAVFAAPEQLLQQKVTERSDVYALAVVLWLCQTRRLPFPVPPELEALSLDQLAPRLAALRKNLPSRPAEMSEAFYQILLPALAMNPASRPTAEGFQKKLEELAGHASRRVHQLGVRLEKLATEHEERLQQIEELQGKLLSNPDSATLREVEQGLTRLEGVKPPSPPKFQILPWFSLGLVVASGFWLALWGVTVASKTSPSSSPAPLSPPVSPPALISPSPSVATPLLSSSTSPNLGTFRHLAGGTFTMGSPTGETDRDKDEDQHSVTISRFRMMEREVTQGMWKAVTGRHGFSTAQQAPSSFSGCGADCPVENVSWCDAVLFANLVSEDEGLRVAYTLPGGFTAGLDLATCNSLSPKVTVDRTAPGYRLPTEAEWEYAARGGTDTVWAGSNTVAEVAWYDKNSDKKTHAGCGKARNAVELCDMSGNVLEWVGDWYGAYTDVPSGPNPLGVLSGSYRVIRGGGWCDAAVGSRVANRSRWSPGLRDFYLGFRLSGTDP